MMFLCIMHFLCRTTSRIIHFISMSISYYCEADSDWKYGNHNYERVQGIVVDIRFLMNNYYGSHKSKIIKMAKLIEEALQENADALGIKRYMLFCLNFDATLIVAFSVIATIFLSTIG